MASRESRGQRKSDLTIFWPNIIGIPLPLYSEYRTSARSKAGVGIFISYIT